MRNHRNAARRKMDNDVGRTSRWAKELRRRPASGRGSLWKKKNLEKEKEIKHTQIHWNVRACDLATVRSSKRPNVALSIIACDQCGVNRIFEQKIAEKKDKFKINKKLISREGERERENEEWMKWLDEEILAILIDEENRLTFRSHFFFFIQSDENVLVEKKTRKIILEEGSSAVRRFSFVNRDVAGATSASSRLSRERRDWRIKIAQKFCHSLSACLVKRNVFSNFLIFI